MTMSDSEGLNDSTNSTVPSDFRSLIFMLFVDSFFVVNIFRLIWFKIGFLFGFGGVVNTAFLILAFLFLGFVYLLHSVFLVIFSLSVDLVWEGMLLLCVFEVAWLFLWGEITFLNATAKYRRHVTAMVTAWRGRLIERTIRELRTRIWMTKYTPRIIFILDCV
jgi:hypothetical protein